MCNAKSHKHSRDELAQFAGELAGQMRLPMGQVPQIRTPRYRIGIKQQHVIVRADDDGLHVDPALWGLVPPNKPDDRAARNNARSDSLRTKWPWVMVQKNRCLSPADGFFEPEKPAGDKSKVPWRFYQLIEGGLFWLPGLYATYEAEIADPETGEITTARAYSYTIVITDANDVIHVHNRMPVILADHKAAARWLTETDDFPDDILVPYANQNMEGWRVPDVAKNGRIPDTEEMVTPVLETGGTLL